MQQKDLQQKIASVYAFGCVHGYHLLINLITSFILFVRENFAKIAIFAKFSKHYFFL
ncbi:hypothetical protein HZA96_02980 [Candidatus Woesearchaeota archaeon]|nr:hypothetical protein [Candidatus Woesearchaeota archaeon]